MLIIPPLVERGYIAIILSVSPSVRLSVHALVRLSVRLSVHALVRLSVRSHFRNISQLLLEEMIVHLLPVYHATYK